ncbi:MAG: hypothetical protein ACON4N_03205 [Myxococcota bacterium]
MGRQFGFSFHGVIDDVPTTFEHCQPDTYQWTVRQPTGLSAPIGISYPHGHSLAMLPENPEVAPPEAVPWDTLFPPAHAEALQMYITSLFDAHAAHDPLVGLYPEAIVLQINKMTVAQKVGPEVAAWFDDVASLRQRIANAHSAHAEVGADPEAAETS